MTPFPIASIPGIFFSMAGRESRNPDKVSLGEYAGHCFNGNRFRGDFVSNHLLAYWSWELGWCYEWTSGCAAFTALEQKIWAVLGQIIKGCFISCWKQWGYANTEIKKVRTQSLLLQWENIGGRWMVGLDGLGGLFRPWWYNEKVSFLMPVASVS